MEGAARLITREGLIDTVECSPHRASSNLVAYGVGPRLTIAKIAGIGGGELNLQELQHLHLGTRSVSISWSSASVYSADRGRGSFNRFQLCVAGADFRIRILDIVMDAGTEECKTYVLEGHTANINSVCINGHLVASGGDDHTARVWQWAEQREVACLTQTSAVASVALARDAESQLELMAAERDGYIRFYEGEGSRWTPICSLSSDGNPLTSAEWCGGNRQLVAALINRRWVYWNKSMSCWGQDIGGDQPDERASIFRWCRAAEKENLFVTVGSRGLQMFNVDLGNRAVDLKLIASEDGNIAGGSWHATHPSCVFARGCSLEVVDEPT